ncbi:unnamed protein product, partial [Symbiodinium sp. CCMP2456]
AQAEKAPARPVPRRLSACLRMLKQCPWFGKSKASPENQGHSPGLPGGDLQTEAPSSPRRLSLPGQLVEEATMMTTASLNDRHPPCDHPKVPSSPALRAVGDLSTPSTPSSRSSASSRPPPVPTVTCEQEGIRPHPPKLEDVNLRGAAGKAEIPLTLQVSTDPETTNPSEASCSPSPRPGNLSVQGGRKEATRFSRHLCSPEVDGDSSSTSSSPAGSGTERGIRASPISLPPRLPRGPAASPSPRARPQDAPSPRAPFPGALLDSHGKAAFRPAQRELRRPPSLPQLDLQQMVTPAPPPTTPHSARPASSRLRRSRSGPLEEAKLLMSRGTPRGRRPSSVPALCLPGPETFASPRLPRPPAATDRSPGLPRSSCCWCGTCVDANAPTPFTARPRTNRVAAEP